MLVIPLIGLFIISVFSGINYRGRSHEIENLLIKKVALSTSLVNLALSFILYTLYDFSNNQFQFVQEHYDLSFFDLYLGIDGISIYFVLLTTIIMPIALLSN